MQEVVERARAIAAKAREREQRQESTAAQELAELRVREPEFAAWVDEFRGAFDGKLVWAHDRVNDKTYGRHRYEREVEALPGRLPKVKRA